MLKIEDYLDKKTWENLNPSLNILNKEYIKEVNVFPVDSNQSEHLSRLMQTEGYFHLTDGPWDINISNLANGVRKLIDNQIMSVFILMYDEVWMMFNKLDLVIKSSLGDNYKILPNFWCWYLDPIKEEAGWKPHRDGAINSIDENFMPNKLTLWLPLTDATPLNGCMYMLPMNRDNSIQIRDVKQVSLDLQNVRALPAKAGDVFCWNHVVFHWGGRSSCRAEHARISMALEYVNHKESINLPGLIPPNYFPSVKERFKICARQILHYRHMYKVSKELEEMIEKYMKIEEVA